MDSLIEICDAINTQTHESLLAGVTPMQLMFFRKPEFQNAKIIHATKEEKRILRQLSVEDIDRFCEQSETSKGKAQKTSTKNHVESALDIIPIEEGDDYEDLNLKSRFSLGIFFFNSLIFCSIFI